MHSCHAILSFVPPLCELQHSRSQKGAIFTAKVAVVNLMKSPKIYRVLVYTKKVFQGGGLFDLCRRRRNRLETCLKNQRNVDKKALFYCCRATKKRYIVYEIFRKMLVRTTTAHRWRSSKKNTCHSRTRKNKSNDLEPHFPISATKSRCLEDTKTAAALPHCSESTKESIAGWGAFGLEVRLELWRNYGTYVK